MTTILNNPNIGNVFTPPATGGNSASNDAYEQFLNILLAQLKNQTPTDPMDTKTFTTQLVQYSSLEQLLAMHDAMDQTNATLNSTRQQQALAYVGRSVEVDSPTSVMQGQTTTDEEGNTTYQGATHWVINLAERAEVSIEITNAAGEVVYTKTLEANAGTNIFTLNSADVADSVVNGQVLTMKATAKNSTNDKVTTDVNGLFEVESADISGKEHTGPLLQAGNLKVASDYIVRVN